MANENDMRNESATEQGTALGQSPDPSTDRESDNCSFDSKEHVSPWRPTDFIYSNENEEIASQFSFSGDRTESIDLGSLLHNDVTHSGSFAINDAIWGTSFGKMLQVLPIPALLVAPSCKITAVNDACEGLCADSRDFKNVPFPSIFLDQSSSDRSSAVIEEVLATRKQKVFEAALGGKKNSIWGRLTFRSIRMASERFVLVLVENLTAEKNRSLLQQKHNEDFRKEIARRKKVEEELAESEKRYREVVELADDFIYKTDEQGRFTFVNSAFLRRSGYSQTELLGQMSIMMVHPKHREKVLKLYQSQFVKRIPETYYEIPVVWKQGESTLVGQKVQLLLEGDRIAGFQSIARDITDLKKAEEKLKASLKEKEALMREIHHRVKNNFQVVSGLLTLQADRVEDKDYLDMFRATQSRINAMAQVHERLYESASLAEVRMDHYLESITRDLIGLQRLDGTRIKLDSHIGNLRFGPDTAIPCGLIVTELVTNALKHAFPKQGEGRIKVILRSIEDGKCEIVVSDDGVGFPEGLNHRNSGGLGFKLVNAFVSSLNGQIDLDSSEGTEVRIKFRLK